MPRSLTSERDFEKPEGNPPGPKAGVEAQGSGGLPRDFQNPRRAERIVVEDFRTKNLNLVHIFFNIISLQPQFSQQRKTLDPSISPGLKSFSDLRSPRGFL